MSKEIQTPITLKDSPGTRFWENVRLPNSHFPACKFIGQGCPWLIPHLNDGCTLTKCDSSPNFPHILYSSKCKLLLCILSNQGMRATMTTGKHCGHSPTIQHETFLFFWHLQRGPLFCLVDLTVLRAPITLLSVCSVSNTSNILLPERTICLSAHLEPAGGLLWVWPWSWWWLPSPGCYLLTIPWSSWIHSLWLIIFLSLVLFRLFFFCPVSYLINFNLRVLQSQGQVRPISESRRYWTLWMVGGGCKG